MLWEERVREQWHNIRGVAEGSSDKSVIPEGPIKRRKASKSPNKLAALGTIATGKSREIE